MTPTPELNALHDRRIALESTLYHLVAHLQREGQWADAATHLERCRDARFDPADIVRELMAVRMVPENEQS